MKQAFSADDSGIGKAIEHLRNVLESKGIRGKMSSRTLVAAEEAMGELAAHAVEGCSLMVGIYSFFGTITIELSAVGDPIDIQKNLTPLVPAIWADSDAKINATLRHLILDSMWKELKYKHRDGINTMHLSVTLPSRALFVTMGALLSAVIIGVLLSATAPKEWLNALENNILDPVKTLYMNALKMIAAPVVFFSIVSCFSKQSNPLGLGKIGAKIISVYMITTLIATGVGIGIYYVFRPGDPSAAVGLSQDVSSITSQMKEISIKDMITGIVPSSFLSPFIENNMIQLLFLAILVGLAIGLIGDYSVAMSTWVEGCSELVLRIASIIMRVTPIVIFCSILSLVLKTGPSSLVSLLSMLGTFLAGLAIMIIVYCLILLLSGINPIVFFRRYFPYMMQVFSIASSNASISLNMEACKKELHIFPEIYSLSIPLGATINMDGTCVLLGVQTLTIAKIYGVDVPTSALLALAVSIILLSIGAPGIPGSGIIILSMLLSQIGVPVEGVALMMGVGPLIGMFICMCNCLGDVVATMAVAKSEKMVDIHAFMNRG